jgi:hypothetical protein
MIMAARIRMKKPRLTVEERLRLFDAATKRQLARNKRHADNETTSRGWTREDLYDRGRTR